MLCPRCRRDLNDPVPECPDCGFHIRQLDEELGDPPARGLLVDRAGLLSENGHAHIAERIQRMQRATANELAAITLQTTAPRLPSEYVFWLFNRWQMGGQDHRGVLLLIAAQERRIEAEVGCGLEHLVSDRGSQRLLERHVAPLLARGAYDQALFLAVDVLAEVIEDDVEETQ